MKEDHVKTGRQDIAESPNAVSFDVLAAVLGVKDGLSTDAALRASRDSAVEKEDDNEARWSDDPDEILGQHDHHGRGNAHRHHDKHQNGKNRRDAHPANLGMEDAPNKAAGVKLLPFIKTGTGSDAHVILFRRFQRSDLRFLLG